MLPEMVSVRRSEESVCTDVMGYVERGWCCVELLCAAHLGECLGPCWGCCLLEVCAWLCMGVVERRSGETVLTCLTLGKGLGGFDSRGSSGRLLSMRLTVYGGGDTTSGSRS